MSTICDHAPPEFTVKNTNNVHLLRIIPSHPRLNRFRRSRKIRNTPQFSVLFGPFRVTFSARFDFEKLFFAKMFSDQKAPSEGALVGEKSRYFFVQPAAGKRGVRNAVLDESDENVYFYNQRYSVYSLFRSQYRNLRATGESKADPIFLTDSGFANCGCGDVKIGQALGEEMRKRRQAWSASRNPVQELLMRSGRDLELLFPQHHSVEDDRERGKNKKIGPRSVSCDADTQGFYKMDGRRVSMLVDELLLKIYGGRERKLSSGGTDIYQNDYSTDSSCNLVCKSNLLKKKCSFTSIPEDKRKKWLDVMRARLMSKSK